MAWGVCLVGGTNWLDVWFSYSRSWDDEETHELLHILIDVRRIVLPSQYASAAWAGSRIARVIRFAAMPAEHPIVGIANALTMRIGDDSNISRLLIYILAIRRRWYQSCKTMSLFCLYPVWLPASHSQNGQAHSFDLGFMCRFIGGQSQLRAAYAYNRRVKWYKARFIYNDDIFTSNECLYLYKPSVVISCCIKYLYNVSQKYWLNELLVLKWTQAFTKTKKPKNLNNSTIREHASRHLTDNRWRHILIVSTFNKQKVYNMTSPMLRQNNLGVEERAASSTHVLDKKPSTQVYVVGWLSSTWEEPYARGLCSETSERSIELFERLSGAPTYTL